MSRQLFRVFFLAMAIPIASGLVVSTPARAQEEPPAPAPGAGSGRVMDGYFLTSILAGFAMFIVCKSARR